MQFSVVREDHYSGVVNYARVVCRCPPAGSLLLFAVISSALLEALSGPKLTLHTFAPSLWALVRVSLSSASSAGFSLQPLFGRGWCWPFFGLGFVGSSAGLSAALARSLFDLPPSSAFLRLCLGPKPLFGCGPSGKARGGSGLHGSGLPTLRWSPSTELMTGVALASLRLWLGLSSTFLLSRLLALSRLVKFSLSGLPPTFLFTGLSSAVCVEVQPALFRVC